jgi:hypothetical protein
LLDRTRRPVDNEMAERGVGFDSCSDEFIYGVIGSPEVEPEDERFEIVEFEKGEEVACRYVAMSVTSGDEKKSWRVKLTHRY